MIDAMLLPLRRYTDFRGRSGRREFWSFALASLAGLIVLSSILGMLGSAVDCAGDTPGLVSKFFQFVVILGWLFLLLPQVALTVRRLHDQGRTGWFILLAVVPVIGSFLLLMLLALPGDDASNAYGEPHQGT